MTDRDSLPASAPAAPPPVFAPGIDTLMSDHAEWIAGRRIGLVSHAAAVDAAGRTSAERLHASPHTTLAALFGPEHGFGGRAGAGVATHDERHPHWNIPVYSLYGETRQPTGPMLAGLDALVIDFQDLGARPYTYVSTLRLVLEAAAAHDLPVIVADRPVPLARGFDGPSLDPACASFVGLVPTPMQYGMTPGETARWLVSALGLRLDLRVAPVRGYARDAAPGPAWPAWVPPSPRIRSWECGLLFTCTVAGEALPALDYGSGTAESFQVIGAPWLDATALVERLTGQKLSGVAFVPHTYVARSGMCDGKSLDGIRIVVTDPTAFKPVTTGVTILAAIQALGGIEQLWSAPGTRPDFFDKLFGTRTVRDALRDGLSGAEIAAGWRDSAELFGVSRDAALLYPS